VQATLGIQGVDLSIDGTFADLRGDSPSALSCSTPLEEIYDIGCRSASSTIRPQVPTVRVSVRVDRRDEVLEIGLAARGPLTRTIEVLAESQGRSRGH